MNKSEVEICKTLDENTYKQVLKNGLEVYICKKKGFKKKIGMFGTKYGSVINNFVDIQTDKKIKVPDGIAHFLEHKLFEQEGENALDLFSKIGVSSNAYTTFDHTVYFFETMDKFEEGMKLLIKLVKTPYFTDENVQKEQGIIAQEIKMYDDDPNFVVYFNALRAMYNTNPVRIDIAGTVESISHITKEYLYTCYNTFYSPQNMFIVIIGDVDVDGTISLIEENLRLYESDYDNKKEIKKIETFSDKEKESICKKEEVKKMDIYMPQICIGYKLDVVDGKEAMKRNIICDIVSDLYFSKMTKFYEEEYKKGILSEEPSLSYEGTSSFSHALVFASSIQIDKLKEDLLNYLEEIKNTPINEDMFELIKKKKIGEMIRRADSLNVSYRRIIEALLGKIDIYEDVNILENITKEDISEFLKLLNEEKQVISIVRENN